MPSPAAAESLRNIPTHKLHEGATVSPGFISVGPDVIRIRQTADFPVGDGWSRTKRDVLAKRREQGAFRGRHGSEAGVGDGRGLLVAGVHLEPRDSSATVTGVDYDGWRAALADQNLASAGVPDSRRRILVGDAVADLQARTDKAPGWHIACIPQAPKSETSNNADGVVDVPSIEHVRDLPLGGQTVDTYGLALNYGYLEALREVAVEGPAGDPNRTDVQVTLSGRAPEAARLGMFRATGWDVTAVYRRRVRQDADTGVAYVGKYAEELDPERGDGFFEKNGTGLYTPISAAEAEDRRQAHQAGRNGASLNVHHDVLEYIAVPATGHKRTEPIPVYEI